jgi:hypothetical protein
VFEGEKDAEGDSEGTIVGVLVAGALVKIGAAVAGASVQGAPVMGGFMGTPVTGAVVTGCGVVGRLATTPSQKSGRIDDKEHMAVLIHCSYELTRA